MLCHLQEGEKVCRVRGPPSVLILRIFNYSYDLEIISMGGVPNAEVFAHRVFFGKESTSKGFIDYCYRLRGRSIFLPNDAASQQACANSLEVLRTDPIKGSVEVSARRAAFDGN